MARAVAAVLTLLVIAESKATEVVSGDGSFSASISKPKIGVETASTADMMGQAPHPGPRFRVSEMPQVAAEIMEGIVETFLQKQQLPPEEVKCLRDGTRQMAQDVLLVGSHVVMFTQELIGARKALPEVGYFPTTTTPDQEWLKEKGLMAERRLDEQDSPNFLMDASAVVMELGLSMQKVAALSHQILHTCLQHDGLEALKTATEHAINVTYVAQRVFLNGADVCSELAEGVESWNSNDREGFGRAIGTALRKLVLSHANSAEIQALPNASILVNITDTFLASFFGPGMALHVRSFQGLNTTDEFRVNLHRCFGENADLVKTMWASTMEVFRAQAEQRLHEATGASEKKEDNDLKKTLTYDMMQIPMALSKCNLDPERQTMLKDAFMGLSDGSLSLTIDTPNGKVSSYSVEDHLARTVECWRNIEKDGGISFGHALGKLCQDLASVAFPQKYLVDDWGNLQLRSTGPGVGRLSAIIPCTFAVLACVAVAGLLRRRLRTLTTRRLREAEDLSLLPEEEAAA